VRRHGSRENSARSRNPFKLLRESGKLVEVALGVFSNGLADYKVPAEQKA